MFLNRRITTSTKDFSDEVNRLKELLRAADAIVVGAGSGLSTSAGFTYTGQRFEDNFSDFIAKYGFEDMYSGGFFPFSSPEEHWAYWSRYIFVNRYTDCDNGTYRSLFELMKDKDYFVLTTNVDHQFQKAGFDKHKLFYTQGDYGLFQCSVPCRNVTYDNEETIREMVARQSNMRIPTELIPRCPVCGKPMTMNLRIDDTFVQDEGWYRASERYADFIRMHSGQKVLFLELGVGMNTPAVIKYPFWRMTARNPNATYACINRELRFCPEELAERSVCICADIGDTVKMLG